jgi:hypothetical protein
MSYTEVESVGWFGRIGNSIKGIVIGIVLVAVGGGLLWWNEGRSVNRAKDLEEGIEAVIYLDSIDKVESGMEGRLVHATGLASGGKVLRDPIFAVEARALALHRVVEMYQWIEKKTTREEKKIGGGVDKVTQYDYELDWRDEAVDSSKFKVPEGHGNETMRVKSLATKAPKVGFGAFTLPDFLVSKIKGREEIPPSGQAIEAAGKYHNSPRLEGGHIYLGDSPDNPVAGDMRISFSIVPEAVVSIIAAQKGETFAPYSTSRKGQLSLLSMGEAASEEMFEQAKADNVALTWGLRLGGFILALIGFNLVLGPLSVLADVIPLIGSIVGGATFVVSLFLSAGISSLVIALAWVAYRPWVGIPLLVVTLGSFVALFFVRKKK